MSPSRWGGGFFASSTMCLPLLCVKVECGFICIIHSVSLYLGGIWGQGLICIIHNVTPFGWRGWGSFASSIVCLPLAWVEIGEHLQYPSQCITLRWRWGKGSFTVLFPLLLVEVREGLICIIHSVSPSTGGGWAYFHPHKVPPSKLEVWMMQMSHSPTSTHGRARHTHCGRCISPFPTSSLNPGRLLEVKSGSLGSCTNITINCRWANLILTVMRLHINKQTNKNKTKKVEVFTIQCTT